MSQWEAWIVTVLGTGVVFIGLVACIVFINLSSRLSRRISWGEEGPGHAGAAEAPAAAATAVAPETGPPLPPDVLAAIATVLELERKLYLNRPGSRVTLRRPALPR